MDTPILHKLLLIFLLMLFPNIISATEIPNYYSIRHQIVGNEIHYLGPKAQLSLPSQFSTKYQASVTDFHNTLNLLPNSSNNSHITVKLSGSSSEDSARIATALSYEEGYWISISKENIEITSSSLHGALFGLTTLQHLGTMHNGSIPTGQIIDWPSMNTRGFLLSSGRGKNHEDIMQAITTARKSRMNSMIFLLNRRISIDVLDGAISKDPITKQQILEIRQHAEENGIEIIPLVNLLTRQSKAVGLMKHADKLGIPHSMYNSDTYDPNGDENYRFIFSYLSEVIDLFKPAKLHIGHSEVFGYAPKHKRIMKTSEEKMLPASLFLQDVVKLYDFLKQRNIETWMWGDMLISKSEFPRMRHTNGNDPGYGRSLRHKIPKEISILDWHYKDDQKEFPSAKTIAEEGYNVIGTTWKRRTTIQNFSRYMSSKVGANGRGMIVGIWNFHKQSTESVSRLVSMSGDIYWSAGE